MKRLEILTILFVLHGAAASAQVPPGGAAPVEPNPRTTIPERIEPSPRPPENPPQSDENMSDRLNQTGGVIRPPSNIDPQIQAPAPEQGQGPMPVIPPPGSPGGDPSIQPK